MRLVDPVHADEQMNQFTIAPVLGTPTVFCWTKTDVAGEAEKLRERRRASTPVHRSTPSPTATSDRACNVQHQRFCMLGKRLSAKPRFHFIADKQNDISSIVVELDYLVDISEVSQVMENLLLESADKLLR